MDEANHGSRHVAQKRPARSLSTTRSSRQKSTPVVATGGSSPKTEALRSGRRCHTARGRGNGVSGSPDQTKQAKGLAILAARANADALMWPELDEWQGLAMKERDFYARDYRECADEEAEAILAPIEKRLRHLEDEMRSRPFQGTPVEVMALAVIALGHQDVVGPGAVKYDGSMKALHCDDIADRSAAELIRHVCMLAQASGLFPILANADFNPRPDLKLIDLGKRFEEGSLVSERLVGMYAAEALSIRARTSAGVRVKMQALAYMTGTLEAGELAEELRKLADEMRGVAATDHADARSAPRLLDGC